MTLTKGWETRESPSRMHINLFLARTGYRKASWRHPATDPLSAATAEPYISRNGHRSDVSRFHL